MKHLVALSILLLSSSAFARVVDTVVCPDGQSHRLSYVYKGQGVPGYFVQDGRYWTARSKSGDEVDFYDGGLDALTCRVTSYRANP